MAGNISDWAENQMLSWVMTTNTVNRPTAWYVALVVSPNVPNDANTGSNLVEPPAANGYARQTVTFGSAATGTTNNTGSVTFTATGDWPNAVTYLAITDASSGGNLLWWGQLSAQKNVASGDSLQFTTGSIQLSLD